MKKIFTFFFFAILLWAGNSTGQTTVFFEGFNGAWTVPNTLNPPWSGTTTANLQWHKNDYTTGWSFTSSGAYSPTGANGTTGSARFHSYGISGGLTSDFITPTIDLSAYTSGTNYLEFYHINATGTDVVNVYLSTNGGVTWGSALITCGVSATWALHTGIVLGTSSANVQIKFTGVSDYGNDDIGIDEVKIYNYDPTAPNLTVVPNSLPFGYVAFGNNSAQQSYVLSGVNLTAGPIVVTAPTGYGVSLTNGGPYTNSVNVSYTPPTLGNTNIYVRFTPTAPSTTYNGNITNIGGSATRNVAVTGNSDIYTLYCASSASYTSDEDIFNVTVGSINNSSTCATLAPGPGSVQNEYSNYFYSVPPANLPVSTLQNFSVQIGTCGGNYNNAVKIFIDYNQNGSFAEANEQVYVSPASTSGPHTETGSFTIPASATLGSTMMRVVNVETSTPSSITSCGTYGWGETEDYQVTISAAATVTTNAATAILGTGATLNATVSANFASTTVAFEYGTMASPPFDHTVTLPSPVTTQGASVNTIISGLQPNTPYYFRAKGTNLSGTTYGSILSFTTLAVPPAVTTNEPTIVGSSFATLNGTATAFNATTTVSFEYGTTLGGPYPNNAIGVPPSISGNAPTDFSATLSGLTINTDYYYRAKGVSIGGTTYGLEKHFFTTCVTPPTPAAISGPAGVCKTIGGYVYSVTPVPYAYVYNWTFPAGFTITSYPNSNSVTVTATNSAVSGTITVRAQSDCGAISPPSPAFSVTVNSLPTPIVTGASPVCQYTSNIYTTQGGNSSYVWTATPDGTVTPNGNTASISWPTPGAKTVGVIYTSPAGCTAAAPGTVAVTVNVAPTPHINGINSMCVNSGYYDYTTESGSGITGYVWTVSSGGTITAGQGTADLQVVWNTPGAQFVTVNYNNSFGCPAQVPTVFNVTVNGLPGAAGSITGTSAVCLGSMGVAYSVSPVTNAIDYVWTLPAGATIATGAGTNSITVDFSFSAVAGDITVYGNSLCGNGASSPPFHVTITQLPLAAGPITGTDTVCAGEMGVAYSVTPVPNATGYSWNLPLGAFIATGANTANITVDFAFGASSGNMSVYGTNSCGNGAASPAFPVVVKPVPPTPFIYATGNTLTSNAPDGNQWYYQGGAIVPGTGQSIVALYTGWYWDVVTLNGCASDTSNNIYMVITGMNEPKGSSFVVYPVPNDGQFKLMMNSPAAEPFNISISNNIGVTVYTKENVTANGPTELAIDLRPIPSGVYTMVIRNSSNKVVRKIVINK